VFQVKVITFRDDDVFEINYRRVDTLSHVGFTAAIFKEGGNNNNRQQERTMQ